MRKTMIALLGASAVLVSGEAFAVCTSMSDTPNGAANSTEGQAAKPSTGPTSAETKTLSATACAYVVEQAIPTARIDGDIVVGQALPETVELHSIPDTVVYVFANVNNKRVLVEPDTRVVVEVVEPGGDKAALATEPMDADKSASDTQPMDADKSASSVEPTDTATTIEPTVAPQRPETAETEPAATARPEGLKAAEVDKISADNLIDATVYGFNDESLGAVGDVILAKDAGPDGKIDAVVIDVGGFLGIGTKPVAIAFDDLEIMIDEDGNYYVYSKFTQEQLEAATQYDAQTFEQNRDSMILRSEG